MTRHAFLIVACFFAISATSVSSTETLTFVFDQDSPPYSWVTQDMSLKGLFPELITSLFEGLPEYKLVLSPMPWNRAQEMVESGTAQGFLTYPSKGRSLYARFTKQSLFVEDIGYLIFSPLNPRAPQLRKVQSFDDLKGFLFLGSEASEWEVDNIPKGITKESVISDETRLKLLLIRLHGDFAIMGLENAQFVLKGFEFDGNIETKKVNFLPDSLVSFNLGISKKYQNNEQLIKRLEVELQKPSVQKKLAEIIGRYRLKQL